MATKAPRSTGNQSARSDSSERPGKALEALERALKLLHKGDYGKAKEQLLKVESTFPDATDILDAVRSYVTVCEGRLAPQKRMKEAEEYVNAGVVELNEGNTQQALKLLAKASELDGKSAHVQYCLAAAHAAAGDAATSARHLKLAIAGDPSARIHAKTDEDFAAVRGSAEVGALLGT